jgi:hypothetical protein
MLNHETVSEELAGLADAAGRLAKAVAASPGLPAITLAEAMVKARKLAEALQKLSKAVAAAGGKGAP